MKVGLALGRNLLEQMGQALLICERFTIANIFYHWAKANVSDMCVNLDDCMIILKYDKIHYFKRIMIGMIVYLKNHYKILLILLDNFF